MSIPRIHTGRKCLRRYVLVASSPDHRAFTPKISSPTSMYFWQKRIDRINIRGNCMNLISLRRSDMTSLR